MITPEKLEAVNDTRLTVTYLLGRAVYSTMLSQLKKTIRESLLSSTLIPMLAFLLVGFLQDYLTDWIPLLKTNRGFQRVADLLAYVFVLLLLLLMFWPLGWLRPKMKVRLTKSGSSKRHPETSEVLNLASRENVADIDIEIEFSPTYWTRIWVNRIGKGELGFTLQWSPPKLFDVAANRQGDSQYSKVLDSEVQIFPLERINLYDPAPISYSFRFGTGVVEVVQDVRLRPRHLNLKSWLLFGLLSESDFHIDVTDEPRRQPSLLTHSLPVIETTSTEVATVLTDPLLDSSRPETLVEMSVPEPNIPKDSNAQDRD